MEQIEERFLCFSYETLFFLGSKATKSIKKCINNNGDNYPGEYDSTVWMKDAWRQKILQIGQERSAIRNESRDINKDFEILGQRGEEAMRKKLQTKKARINRSEPEIAMIQKN